MLRGLHFLILLAWDISVMFVDLQWKYFLKEFKICWVFGLEHPRRFYSFVIASAEIYGVRQGII